MGKKMKRRKAVLNIPTGTKFYGGGLSTAGSPQVKVVAHHGAKVSIKVDGKFYGGAGAVVGNENLTPGVVYDSDEISFPNWGELVVGQKENCTDEIAEEIIVQEFNEKAKRYFLEIFGSKLPKPRHVSWAELNGKAEQPPTAGEYLICWFLPLAEQDAVVGDLAERYPKRVEKFGARAAWWWYYKQVFSSIGPLVRKAVMKWGAFGWVAEWIRRISS